MPIVVIVDDQFTSRRILEELATSLDPGIEVQAFGEPQQALDYCSANDVSLIITDYQMPGMTGVDLLKHVRATESCQDAPVIVVTITEDKHVQQAILEAGALDVLTKPIDHHQLLTRMRNAIESHERLNSLKSRIDELEQQLANR